MSIGKMYRRRLLLVLALALSGMVLLVVSLGRLEKNLVYYVTPTDLLANDTRSVARLVRLGGVVQHGSVRWQPNILQLSFRLSNSVNGNQQSVAVLAHGAPPQMFQEGLGAVVEGHYDGHCFQADRVLVKHSNEYRPPGPNESPQKLYKTLLPAP